MLNRKKLLVYSLAYQLGLNMRRYSIPKHQYPVNTTSFQCKSNAYSIYYLYASEILPPGRDADNVPAWTWIEISPSLLQAKHFHCTVSLHIAHVLTGSNSWPHDLHSIWIIIVYTKSFFNNLLLLPLDILKKLILYSSNRGKRSISNIKYKTGSQNCLYKYRF